MPLKVPIVLGTLKMPTTVPSWSITESWKLNPGLHAGTQLLEPSTAASQDLY